MIVVIMKPTSRLLALGEKLSGKELEHLLKKYNYTWEACWEMDDLSPEEESMLLSFLSRMPNSSVETVAPHPEVLCTRLMTLLHKDPPTSGLHRQIYLYVTIIEKLLNVFESYKGEVERDMLLQVITLAKESLQVTQTEFKERSLFLQTFMDWELSLREVSSLKHKDWKCPTVSWLLSDELFNPVKLPKMKIPNDKSNGIYYSMEEYIDTLYKLWVAITFSDGHAALSVRCKVSERVNKQPCASVLRPKAAFQDLPTCGHSNTVVYCCNFRNHRRSSICETCYKICQKSILGATNNKSSTDIYDATLRRYEQKGILFFSNVVTRRPPNVTINWSTTYRLCAPALVGLVKIARPNCAITPLDRIFWGKVEPYTHDRREDISNRARGNLKVSLISCLDELPRLKFYENASYAIIDCRTFVPEPLPVLNVFEHDAVDDFPLAKYLNINPVCIEKEELTCLLDSSSNQGDLSVEWGSNLPFRIHIEKLIETSYLEPFKVIRKNPELHQKCKKELSSLVDSLTLDHEQLKSLICALQYPVHLTQGPPGTGKSYLGNHAIDEFLLDLAKSSKLSMIRFGKCTEPGLSWYLQRPGRRNDYISVPRKLVELLDHVDAFSRRAEEFLLSKDLFFCKKFNAKNISFPPSKRLKDSVEIFLDIICKLEILHKANEKVLESAYGGNEALEKEIHFFTELFLKNARKNNVLKVLQEEIMHLGIFSEEDMLFRWLMGWKPHARCTVEGCPFPVIPNPDSSFCRVHKCEYSGCEGKKCMKSSVELIPFCQIHCCREETCVKVILKDSSYCEVHTCIKCIELKIFPPNLSIYDYPKNVCEIHELCSVVNCFELIAKNGRCTVHQRNKCLAMLEEGLRCKKWACNESKTLCKLHFQSHGRVKNNKNKKNKTKKKLLYEDRSDLTKKGPLISFVEDQKEDERQQAEEQCYKKLCEDRKEGWKETFSSLNLRSEMHRARLEEDKHKHEQVDEACDTREGSAGCEPPGYPINLSWGSTLGERWAQAKYLTFQSKSYLTDVRKRLVELYYIEKEKAIKTQAKVDAKEFERAQVLGGTVVGCISRLESIRKSNPFAIVVEEASEVVEPLLFASFVKSLTKIELIGDQRQLKPSINKFEYEIINNMNISMFERLICCGTIGYVPRNYLRVQRRMRPNIADLTRKLYEDLTKIQDEPCCLSKCINGGSLNNLKSLGSERGIELQDYGGYGREVPGVIPHLFFWLHSGRQTHAAVGLSRKNELEVQMVIKLVKHINSAGVDLNCIAVLTPYKGQLLALRKGLQQQKLFNFGDKNTIRLSTIDRFQGDEEDIVVVSLVLDQFSRTTFIKQVNRMIVLLSRARIGLYLVGNETYFSLKTGALPDHWINVIKYMQLPLPYDTAIDPNREIVQAYSQKNIGKFLPICCGKHRSSIFLLKEDVPVPKNICKVLCTAKLACGHACGKLCHWPSERHQDLCMEELEAPCLSHPRIYKCHEIVDPSYNKITYESSVASSVPLFQLCLEKKECSALVEIILRCGHTEEVKCSENSSLNSDSKKREEFLSTYVCKKVSPLKFYRPSCNHEEVLLCYQYHRLKRNPALCPPCLELVVYTPLCNHSIKVECWKSRQYHSGTQFVCKETVETVLPRCGHKAYVPCVEMEALGKWSGNPCLTDTVNYNEIYGRRDFKCTELATFKRSCGHLERVCCFEAFQWTGTTPPKCTQNLTNVPDLVCGHVFSIECGELFQTLKNLQRRYTHLFGGLDLAHTPFDVLLRKLELLAPAPINFFSKKDGIFYNNGPPSFVPCAVTVSIEYECGHKSAVPCCKAKNWVLLCNSAQLSDSRHALRCEEVVEATNPICYHQVKLQCHLNKLISELRVWPDEFYLNGAVETLRVSGVVEENHMPSLAGLQQSLKTVLVSCKESVLVKLSSCGHLLQRPCTTAFSGAKRGALKCASEILYPCDNCGKDKIVPCEIKEESKKKAYQCKNISEKKCANYIWCQNTVPLPCAYFTKVICHGVYVWTCALNQESHFIKLRCNGETPPFCPFCEQEKAKDEIFSLQYELSDETVILNKYAGKALGTLEDAITLSGIDNIKQEVCGKTFVEELEGKLSCQYEAITQCANLRERVRFQSCALPVFLVIKKRQFESKFNFSMVAKENPLGKGVLFKLLHRCNLVPQDSSKSTLSNKDFGQVCVPVHLALGLGITYKPLILNFGDPESLKKKSLKINRADGFDAVINKARNEILFWEPKCVLITHKVLLKNDSSSATFLSCFPEAFSLYNSLKIEFFGQDEVGDGDLLVEMPKTSVAETTAITGVSIKPSVKLKKLLCKVLKNYAQVFISEDMIDFESWDGLSLNIKEESFVKSRMTYFTRESQRTFSGVKCLENLCLQEPFAFLLLFFETYHLKFLEEAKTSLVNYLKTVSCHIHPLLLLALARLFELENETVLTGSSQFKNEKIICYSHFLLFANTEEKRQLWLSCDELERLKRMEEGEKPEHCEANVNPTVEAKTSIEDQWEELKVTSNISSISTDNIMRLTGLQKVKKEALNLVKMINLLKSAKTPMVVPFNFSFEGNPGTGKTTVARLFSGIFKEFGFLPRKSNEFVEISVHELKEKSSEELDALLKTTTFIFIDEAYLLDPKNDPSGARVADKLLSVAEKHRGRVSIVLAGYEEEMDKKFFAYNQGLRGRFKTVKFENFTKEELKKIWVDTLKQNGFKGDNTLANVVCRRLEKRSTEKDFGNARAVRQTFEDAVNSAAGRVQTGDLKLIVEDVLGPRVDCNDEKIKPLLDKIYQSYGWKRVAEAVRDLIAVVQKNYDREIAGETQLPLQKNRVLLGSPGTGKTTFAKLYGQLLKNLGILSKGEVVEATSSDLKGAHIGESTSKTKAMVEKCRGNVLIIDEVYTLDDTTFGKEVLDTLVEKVQGAADEDIAVLLLGYEEQVVRMFNNQNPGLRRRFPLESAFHFEDFKLSELMEIFKALCQQEGIGYTLSALKEVENVLDNQKCSSLAGFGNAGAVNNLFKSVISRCSRKDRGIKLTIEAEDVRELKKDDPYAMLDQLYNINSVKETIKKLECKFLLAEKEGAATEPIGHFIFTGSPGTGKTTVARMLALILYRIGIISSQTFKQTSGLELTGNFVGQTKSVVIEKLKAATGGVLLIDEAYELGKGPFGTEALTTLVECMTNPEYSGVVIIMAGYKSDIDSMLNTNEGLKSRMRNYIEFKDWTVDDSVQYFLLQMNKEHYKLSSECEKVLKQAIEGIKSQKGWANARDVNTLYLKVKEQRAYRIMTSNENSSELSFEIQDIKDMAADIIKQRNPLITDVEGIFDDSDPFKPLNKLYNVEHIRDEFIRIQASYAMTAKESKKPSPLGHFLFVGRPGTGKTTVARMLAKILFKLKIIPSPNFRETSATNLTAQFVGQTKERVKAQLNEARGGVLFIDEAYELGKGSFGEEAMTTLLEAMTHPLYDDLVIVMAGYKDEMTEMLNRNPGLKSRFGRTIEFKDWAPEHCLQYFKHKMKESGYKLEEGVERIFVQLVTGIIHQKGWGNGRDVSKIIQELKGQISYRLLSSSEENDTASIKLEDIKPVASKMIKSRNVLLKDSEDLFEDRDPYEELGKLRGMEHIIKELRKLEASLEISKVENGKPTTVGHFLFIGSPGTGKTSVARMLAKLLFKLKVLPSPNYQETSGLNLTGEYVGQTKEKVKRLLSEAQGGLLFIDEAYELGNGSFGQEAITMLVQAITDPLYSSLVIVLAGYKQEMSEMLDRNQGLKSRITRLWEFKDWTVQDCADHFTSLLESEGFKLGEGVVKELKCLCTELIALPGWGNGRDVVEMAKKVKEERALRVWEVSGSYNIAQKVIELRDFCTVKSEFLKQRVLVRAEERSPRKELASFTKTHSSYKQLPQVNFNEPMEMIEICPEESKANEVRLKEERLQLTANVADQAEDEQKGDLMGILEKEGLNKCPRDSGVSEEVWASLLRNIKKENVMCRVVKKTKVSLEVLQEESSTKKEEYLNKKKEIKEAQKRLAFQENEEQKRILKNNLKKLEEKKKLIKLEKIKKEEELRLKKEELRKLKLIQEEKRKIQEKLKVIRKCPQNYDWIPEQNGWRCKGGGHFVTKEELNSKFTFEITRSQ
ncbi:uncharacterized protein LOC135145735 isoform X4 [Zophobas morio]|uniref:uncharacterized protein LOC135145735 isoform X4 n=1 Tax=Zophobas morio TaxID=2755281 RepID=UPI0030833E38